MHCAQIHDVSWHSSSFRNSSRAVRSLDEGRQNQAHLLPTLKIWDDLESFGDFASGEALHDKADSLVDCNHLLIRAAGARGAGHISSVKGAELDVVKMYASKRGRRSLPQVDVLDLKISSKFQKGICCT